MKKLTLHSEQCKACGLCISFCPKKALYASDRMNEKGYLPTMVDMEKCIVCGTCFIMCPDYVFEITES